MPNPNRLRSDLLVREHEALLNTDLMGIARLQRSRFAWTNATFDLMFGYEPGELRGRRATALYPDNTVTGAFEREPRALLARDGTYRSQLRLQKKGGEGVWADVRGTLLSTRQSLWMLVDVTGWKEQATRIETLAFHDPLTRLPNRAMLRQLLERELANCRRLHDMLAVCFVDLDQFKPVNDLKGHEAGDCVLQAVAARIQDSVRGNDIVGRIGGDEFVIVLTHLENRQQVQSTLSRVLERLREPVALHGGGSAEVSASIGVAICPDDAVTAQALLRCADEAMYGAKAGGRDRWRFHESSA